jgi:hypothetical protein
MCVPDHLAGSRRAFRRGLLLALAVAGLSVRPPAVVVGAAAEETTPENGGTAGGFTIVLTRVRTGFDGKTCWVHPRAGVMPAGKTSAGLAVLTMQRLLLSGSDVFYGLHTMTSADGGRTWDRPVPEPNLARRTEADGTVIVVANFTPQWHAASGKVVGIGNTVRYRSNRLVRSRPSEVAWSVYDAEEGRWQPWRTMRMPDAPRFEYTSAGCTQRVDLPDGRILQPVGFRPAEAERFSTAVVLCRFDGKRLQYVEHGNEMSVPVKRGLYEPSLVRFRGRFYLTLRNDERGYVTCSDDGLHFERPRPWTFDDGADLGNYNTQQHWLKGPDALYLVYTRRGAKNDHVFRHRAPLFMARVDADRLCVIRSSEQVLVPERGARLGNFGVCRLGPRESWVVVSEWMQPRGVERYGSDNSVYAAKVCWPARDVQADR